MSNRNFRPPRHNNNNNLGYPQITRPPIINLATRLFPRGLPAMQRPQRFNNPILLNIPSSARFANSTSQNSGQGGNQNQRNEARIREALQYSYFRILTGNVTQFLQWATIPENRLGPLFEVTGYITVLLPLRDPKDGIELNFMLRDRRDSGPLITIIYPHHLFSPRAVMELQPGKYVRCMGRIIEINRMLAIRVTPIDPADVPDYDRINHASTFFNDTPRV